MKVKIGSVNYNKTWHYLVPCLKKLGFDFNNRFNSVFKLGVGIYDYDAPLAAKFKPYCLFMLFDTKYNTENFAKFLAWVQCQSYYIIDYSTSKDIRTCRKHMIVIELPEILHHIYNCFIAGMYSKMLKDKTEIKKLYKSGTYSRDVMLRTREGEKYYNKKLKKLYDCELTSEELEDVEFEFPLVSEEEVFNYRGTNKYINIEEDMKWLSV